MVNGDDLIMMTGEDDDDKKIKTINKKNNRDSVRQSE